MSTPERGVAGSGEFFGPGDRVQLTGPKGKLHSITLQAGAVFHSHKGRIAHDDIIGLAEGSVVRSANGADYLVLRPLLSDFVLSMPRGAAIIYPKDAAQILAMADIFPGATVVEAGVGSGALSLWLLRAIGNGGRLYSFERREEFAAIARGNVTAFSGTVPTNWTLTEGDLTDALPVTVTPASIDRVVLDMLTPWECLDAVSEVLRPGGVLLCYLATVTQLSRTIEALRQAGGYTPAVATETIVRGWHVDGLAVRPNHRMIGHTGFLLSVRRLAPGVTLPAPQRRASKSEFSEEDIEAWTPGAVGERSLSAKSLRQRVRQANAVAE